MDKKCSVKEAIQVIEDAMDDDPPEGDWHIVVLDRGWIFVGILEEFEDGTYALSNAKNVRKWTKNGFGGLTKGAISAEATLDPCAPLKFAASAMMFCVPVSEDWDAK